MIDHEAFVKDQVEAGTLAVQLLNEAPGYLTERHAAIDIVLRLADHNSEPITIDQVISQARRLAEFLAGRA